MFKGETMRSDAAFIKEQFRQYIDQRFVPSWKNPGDRASIVEYRDRSLRIASRGVLVTGYLIQANYHLYEPGPGPVFFCAVLASFDPAVADDRTYMMDLVRKIQRLKGTTQSDPDLAYTANMITDEMAYRDRRRPLPMSMTGGRIVYLVDLMLYRSRLSAGHITESEILCIAEPGDAGGIEQVPYWIERGMPADAVKYEAGASTSSWATIFNSPSRGSGTARVIAVLIALAAIVWRASPHIPQPGQDVNEEPDSPSPVATQPQTYTPPQNFQPRGPSYSAPVASQPGPYMPANTPYMSGRRFPGNYGVNRPGMPGYPFGPRRSPYFSGPGSSIAEPPNPYAGIKLQPGFTMGPGGAPIPPGVRPDPQPNTGDYAPPPPPPSTQSPPDPSTQPPPDAGTPPPPDYQQTQQPPPNYGNGDQASVPPVDQSGGQGGPQYPPADDQPPQQ